MVLLQKDDFYISVSTSYQNLGFRRVPKQFGTRNSVLYPSCCPTFYDAYSLIQTLLKYDRSPPILHSTKSCSVRGTRVDIMESEERLTYIIIES